MREVIYLQGLHMLKKKIKDCNQQLYVNTLYNSDEMDRFFKDTDYQSSLKKQQITWITLSIKEIDIFILKTLPQRLLQWWTLPNIWGRTNINSMQTLVENCPSLFCEFIITVILTSNTEIIRKENYISVSVLNIHVKNLNEFLGNQIQLHIKGIIYLDQVECIPVIQGKINRKKIINVI